MPLDASLVGTHLGAIDIELDARWCMAFAAGLGDLQPDRYDTTAPLVVHPMLAVSPEWQLFTEVRPVPEALTLDELLTGVHRHHHLEVHRPLQVGAHLRLDAHVASVDRHRAGATQTVAFIATDDVGPVWTTRFTTLFRGVALEGEPTPSAQEDPAPPARPEAEDPDALPERTLHVGPLDAQRYTACARIWNPIHTDLAFARSVGLDGPILHGTATLGRAVSTVADLLDIELPAVASIEGTFAATVPIDSEITVQVLAADAATVTFEVRNHVGRRAIAGGRLGVRPS